MTADFTDAIASLEAEIDAWAPPQRDTARAYRRAIDALHEEALRRLIKTLRDAGAAPALRDAVADPVVYAVGEAAAGRRVSRVTLDIGRLSGVMDEAIRFCFPIVAEGTVLAGAALDINLIDGRAKCGDCDAEFFADTLFTPCPCGSRATVRLAGEELLVKTMDLEETG